MNRSNCSITYSILVFVFLYGRKTKECALHGRKEAKTEQKTEYDTMYWLNQGIKGNYSTPNTHHSSTNQNIPKYVATDLKQESYVTSTTEEMINAEE
jgi:hypothetical protein